MALENSIGILITAADEATPVLAAVGAKAKALSAETDALSDSNAVLADASSGAADALVATDVAAADASKTLTVAKDASTDAKDAVTGLSDAAIDSRAVMGEFAGQVGASGAMLGLGPGSLATAATIAAVALGFTAVKAAGDFQAALTRLVTSAGESEKNLQLVGNGILDLAVQTGTSTKQLTSAMYTIESGGQHGAAGLQVLKAAAEGAKTENADLATVADAVTSALTDYHYAASQAATVTSKLVAATGQGKTTFQDLAGAMPAILPIASAAHVSLSEILGDLASMTEHGMSADQAAQNLASTIRSLLSPTQASSKELAALGLNATELSQNLGTVGLEGTLQKISQAIQKDMGPQATAVILNMTDALKGLPQSVQEVSQDVINGTATWRQWNVATKDLTVTQRSQAQAFATLYNGMHTIGTEQLSGAQVMQTYAGALHKAIGTSEGLNTALMLTGQNTDTTTRAINAVSSATADASGNVQGWTDVQGNFNQQMAVFGQVVGTSFIRAGQAVIQVWNNAAKLLAPAFGVISEAWNKYFMPMINWISGGQGAQAAKFFGVVLVAAIVALAAPLIVLGATLMEVGAVIERVASWGADLGDWLGKTFPKDIQGAISWLGGLGTSIGLTFENLWNDAVGGLTQFTLNVSRWAESVVDGVVSFFTALPSRIGSAIGGAFRGAENDVKSILHGMGIPGFALGTNFAPGGLALVGENGPELINLPSGSEVINAQQTRQMLGGGPSVSIGNVIISNQMDQQRFLKDLGWRLSIA